MTTKDLRAELFRTMQAVKCGSLTIKEASQINKSASQIVYAKRLDLESKRLNIDIMKATKAKKLKDVDTKDTSL